MGARAGDINGGINRKSVNLLVQPGPSRDQCQDRAQDRSRYLVEHIEVSPSKLPFFLQKGPKNGLRRIWFFFIIRNSGSYFTDPQVATVGPQYKTEIS